MIAAWWTVITRHPSSPPGVWRHGSPVYETREAAIASAHEAWDGTNVEWRLMSIPVDDEEVTR